MKDRPEGRRLFDMLRAGFTLVIWWVDRLGRNHEDVTNTVRKFLERGVTIQTIIHGMVFNGQPKNAMEKAIRNALVSFMAATAEAQAEATKEAQRAGIKAAKARHDEGRTPAYLGRKPSFSGAHAEAVQRMETQGITVTEMARLINISRQTICRVKEDPKAAQTALAVWQHPGRPAGLIERG